jgi:hypothetical protein
MTTSIAYLLGLLMAAQAGVPVCDHRSAPRGNNESCAVLDSNHRVVLLSCSRLSGDRTVCTVR